MEKKFVKKNGLFIKFIFIYFFPHSTKGSLIILFLEKKERGDRGRGEETYQSNINSSTSYF